MDQAAHLIAHQRRITLVLDLVLSRPHVGRYAQSPAIGQRERTTAAPGIVDIRCDIGVGLAYAKRYLGLPKSDALEGPAAIGALGGGERAKGRSEERVSR